MDLIKIIRAGLNMFIISIIITTSTTKNHQMENNNSMMSCSLYLSQIRKNSCKDIDGSQILIRLYVFVVIVNEERRIYYWRESESGNIFLINNIKRKFPEFTEFIYLLCVKTSYRSLRQGCWVRL